MILHGYFRSSAAWRVRLALGLKGLAYEDAFHHLRRGEQRAAAYLALNPQALLPALEVGGGEILTQSMAILEYLEETQPSPALLPRSPLMRGKVRAFAQAIVSDIHPVQNLRVLARLRELGLDEDAVSAWAAHFIGTGLDACERLVADRPEPFAFGDAPGMADICLIPQLYNARRFGLEPRWPRLAAIERHCEGLPVFIAAHPLQQADAE